MGSILCRVLSSHFSCCGWLRVGCGGAEWWKGGGNLTSLQEKNSKDKATFRYGSAFMTGWKEVLATESFNRQHMRYWIKIFMPGSLPEVPEKAGDCVESSSHCGAALCLALLRRLISGVMDGLQYAPLVKGLCPSVLAKSSCPGTPLIL
jgi:hypothetical protein